MANYVQTPFITLSPPLEGHPPSRSSAADGAHEDAGASTGGICGGEIEISEHRHTGFTQGGASHGGVCRVGCDPGDGISSVIRTYSKEI